MSTTKPRDPNVHTRKRPYQPSITSFFARNASSSDPNKTIESSPLSPPLPAETQASLLSVGMRVRKSVPEGYKTHKTLNAEGFPFPNTAPETTMTGAQRPGFGSQGSSSSRELTPFCGLHKIGGFGLQAGPASSAPAVMRGDGEGVPGLTMSQSSLEGTRGGFGGGGVDGSKKRGFEEEIEDDLDDYFDEVDALDAEKPGRRPVAGLKGFVREGVPGVTVHCVDVDDFEEAGFLAPRDGMDVYA